MVTARAPATSANVGSGFDTFGIALESPYDTVTVSRAATTTIEVHGTGASYVPEDPEANTVGAVARELDAPAHIRIDKGVRPASGMGSSAASAAAAAVALNELYGLGYDREALIPIAAEGEAVVSGTAHTDNVAPALLGGFTVGRADGTTAVETELSLVVCLPDIAVSTRDAREAVPERVSMADHVTTVGNAATVAVGVCRDDPKLVGRGMADPVVTPARAAFVDGYETVCAAAREAGATGVTISGAGPALLAVVRPGRSRAVAAAMVEAFDEHGVEARSFRTGVGDGAHCR
ncbi:MAG: homoserine kinase [Halobaculum sp.]